MTAVDRFGAQLAELRETLLSMPEDERLHAVFANDVELLGRSVSRTTDKARSRAEAFPERLAVAHGPLRRNYRDFHARSKKLASAPAKRGFVRGDTVAAMLANTPAMLECHYGVPMCGAVLNTLNTRLYAAAVAFMLDHGEAKAMIVGHTGDPKGVVYHDRGANLLAVGNVITADMRPHPVYLWTLPMFHCNGWCFPWSISVKSGTPVCLRQVRAKAMYDLIAEQGSRLRFFAFRR
jgi:acyl-CoA synthetase (AMP-forming)/AMP-acid ligase II